LRKTLMANYIGLMSGTSCDGIDAACVEIAEPRGFRLLATHHLAYPGEVRAGVLSLVESGHDEISRAGELDGHLGTLFADAVQAVLQKAGLTARDIRAIGSHGQTVRHAPAARIPYTLQIGNPAIIAERAGVTTVADFRRRDIAAGGEGAPLVPAFHGWLFGGTGAARVVVNIGGIANVTILPARRQEAVRGFDTGPGNVLMDLWTSAHLGRNFDEDGNWAASGQPDMRLLARLLAEPFFSRAPPKSTGRELFRAEWIEQMLQGAWSQLAPADVQATLAELTARSITDAINDHATSASEIFVCGGGARNGYLMKRLAGQLAPRPVDTTKALGLDPQWVEASAFAWLAHQAMDGKPGNLPSVTGARHPAILGAIFPA
jgi:anhydro-N-acetylmuramic acid kinase